MERLLEIYKEKKAAPQSQLKPEDIRIYGAMRFEECADEMSGRPGNGTWLLTR